MGRVQTPAPTKKLQRRYNLIGAELPQVFLSPELLPVAIVDDLTQIEPSDGAFERRAVVIRSQASPGAGNFARVSLTNPEGSGVLVVVDHIWASVGTVPGNITFNLSATAVPVESPGFYRDTRVGEAGAIQSPVGAENGSNGVLPTAFAEAHITVSSGFLASEAIQLDWVIEPGFILRVHNGSANDGLSVQFAWRERSLGT